MFLVWWYPSIAPSSVGCPATLVSRDRNDLAHEPLLIFQALLQELSYASYLNVETAILPAPRNRAHLASYGRAINNALTRIPYMQFSIRLPIYNPSIFRADGKDSSSQLIASPMTSHFPPSPDTPEIRIPLKAAPSTRASEAELNATWEMWDMVRSMCGYNTRLTLSNIDFYCRPADA